MSSEATSSPTSTLYRGGVVYSPADPLATAMLVSDDQIAWIGSEEAAAGLADGVGQVVDLAGGLVTPTFVDAHVHVSATGMTLRSAALTDVRSLQEASVCSRPSRPSNSPRTEALSRNSFSA